MLKVLVLLSRPTIKLTITILLFLVLGTAIAQDNRLKSVVDSAVQLEIEQQRIAGAAVGVIIGGRVVYTGGYGFADIDRNQPFTSDTLINWASNSKPFMAVLALQLFQSGKLDIDATIDNYMPNIPEHLHLITTRDLLCHQSGIPHYSNGLIVSSELHSPEDEFDPSLAMDRFIKSPLIFQPGEKKEYSSYAYVLLSAIVQAVGGDPIKDQIANRITRPLSMTSFQLDVLFENQDDWSKAYRLADKKFIEVSDEANYWKHGAGGYKSNVKDFAVFAASLMQAKLIDLPTSIEMMTRQHTDDGKQTDFGLGVAIEGVGRNLKVSHDGSQLETKTRMVLYPNEQNGIVVMCNCNHAEPGEISTAIYSAFKKNRITF